MKILKNKKYRLISNISRYSFFFILIFTFIMPFVFVGAIEPVTGTTGITPVTGTVSSDTNTAFNDVGIKNPIAGEVDTIPEFIEAIIKAVLMIGIPILVLAIIYAGFLYVKAQGNPGELEVAHRTLLYTIIGGALLLGAFVIANAIGSTVSEIERTS